MENEKDSEYVLGVGDSVDISVYRLDELKRSFKIDPSGKFMYPMIGDVDATGKGIFKLRDEMAERLSKYFVEPQVMITVTTPLSRKAIILGEVNTPGVIVLDSDTSVMEAVSKAGGLTHDASLENVLLLRKNNREPDKPVVAIVPITKVIGEGDLSQNIFLRNGDIVYVFPKNIAETSRLFAHIAQILAPIVNLESGVALWPQVKDAIRGKTVSVPLTIPAK